MSKTIQHKRSSIAGNKPNSTQIAVGELGINFPDKTIYTKDGNGEVIKIGEALPHQEVLDPDNCTSSEFIGGSGTESDPFEVDTVNAKVGEVEVHVATVKITGLEAGQVVYVEDLDVENNGDRFTAGSRIADESGVLTVNITMNDNPRSSSTESYSGRVRIGDTVYIDVSVIVREPLEGGTIVLPPLGTGSNVSTWNGEANRTLTASYPLMISEDGYNFIDKIEVHEGDTFYLKWAGDPGSGVGIDGPHGTVISGSVTDDVGGSEFFELTIDKETSFVFHNFVDSDQTLDGQSESRVVTVRDVNSYVYPYGSTTGDSAQYAVNGGDWTDMPATNSGSSTDYMNEGDEFQLRHRDAATNNTASTYNFNMAGDSADWTTVTADIDPVILQPKIASPATDGEISISPDGPFVSSDFEMAQGVDTHTASSWEIMGGLEFTEQPSFTTAVGNKSMEGLAWDGTQFCAVGQNCACATSPDGVTWTNRPSLAAVVSGDYPKMDSVVWNGTQFCAVGSEGNCATSPDGITWTHQPSLATAVESSYMYSVVWDGNQFCAVGKFGKCATSPDGVTWTNRPSLVAAVSNNVMWSVTWTGTQFCTVGYEGKCATSPDGVTWTGQPSFTTAVGSSTRMNSVTWSGSQFCAVGWGKCATSPDGVTWTNQPSFTAVVGSTTMWSVIWDGGQFITVGDGGMCATSPDGVTWTLQDGLGKTKYAMAWDGSQFCAVGKSGTAATGVQGAGISLDSDTSALTSWEPTGLEGNTDYKIRVKHHTATLNSEWSEDRSFRIAVPPGEKWTNQPSLASAVGVTQMNSIAWTGTQFCAVGKSGRCATSPDGVTWTNQPSFEAAFDWPGTAFSVVWSGTQFCAVGTGSCATSPDGVTWTKQPNFATLVDSMYAITWDGNQFCAVGQDGKCVTSPDGVTWTLRPSLASAVASTNMNSITWDGTKFCAVGDSGKCATSPDGVTWSLRPSLAFKVSSYAVMNSIAWNGTKFCVVAQWGKCGTSPDGVNWTNQPGLASAVGSDGYMFSVVWDGTQFCAIGDGGKCATSPDGVTWTNQPSLASAVSNKNMYSIASDGNQFCVVGVEGACATSP